MKRATRFIQVLPALLVTITLAGCSRLKPLPPMSPAHSDEADPPLKIEFYGPKSPADFTPVKGRYGGESIPARLYVMARITNISAKPVVLVGFCRDTEGACDYFCASPNARKPPFFISYNGLIEWILLKSGESAYGIDNVAYHIAFLQPGHYDVDYQYRVPYAYDTASPSAPPESQDQLEHYHRDHEAVAHGTVDLFVLPTDVYSPDWKL